RIALLAEGEKQAIGGRPGSIETSRGIQVKHARARRTRRVEDGLDPSDGPVTPNRVTESAELSAAAADDAFLALHDQDGRAGGVDEVLQVGHLVTAQCADTSAARSR